MDVPIRVSMVIDDPSVQNANRTATCRCFSGGIVCGWMSGQPLTTHSFHGGNWSVW